MPLRLLSFCSVLLSLHCASAAEPAPPSKELLDKLTAAVNKCTAGHMELLSGPTAVSLPGAPAAWTVLFRDTSWHLKDEPQSADVGAELAREAMRLPEEERLKKMDRFDDHIQFWLVPADAPTAAALKDKLPFTEQPNQWHREIVCLGERQGFTFYACAPIYNWIRIQTELTLKNGDDPIQGAIRALGVEDKGRCTANSCGPILVEAGMAALPAIKTAVADKHPQRAQLVGLLCYFKADAARSQLLAYASSADETVAEAARRGLLWVPKKDAEKLYVQWLDEGAGKKNVRKELRACGAVDAKDAAPILPRVLAAPTDVHEYRSALELSRKLAGKPPIGAALLEAEQRICGLRGHDQGKPSDAVAEILRSDDKEAVAAIGLSLALFSTKADCRPVNEAGVSILRALPDGAGLKLVRRLRSSMARDGHDDELARLEDALKTVVP
ncbi:MAG: hypothetical protein NTW87_05395 [Planctomycetota bacterium]|nr:hypothetical protein [Planctomycetota bacterium]